MVKAGIVNAEGTARAIRLPVLRNSIQPEAHKLFRIWRVAHPLGLVLCVNGRRAIWHSSYCHHLEDPETCSKQWERWLTNRRKVLGGTVNNLKGWAYNEGLEPKGCSHCKKSVPSAAEAKAALEHGFELVQQADARAVAQEAERIVKPSSRSAITIQRIVRDTKSARTTKQLHQYRCQMCRRRIVLPDGRFYAEAHHIQPLGRPHGGPDVPENILCVCPNHHVALDYRCFRIEKAKLRTRPDHRVSDKYIAYHNKLCAEDLGR